MRTNVSYDELTLIATDWQCPNCLSVDFTLLCHSAYLTEYLVKEHVVHDIAQATESNTLLQVECNSCAGLFSGKLVAKEVLG